MTAIAGFAHGAKPAPYGKTLEGETCKGGKPTSGPYDYLLRNRTTEAGMLEVVEENHFNEDVENLNEGMTDTLAGDIGWVLNHFPNHHRALDSAVTYRLKYKKRWSSDRWRLPPECHLERAIRFNPRDPVPYNLYGYYLMKRKEYEKAAEVYGELHEMVPRDPLVEYNLGLALVKSKRFEEARPHARKVYDEGFPLPGLRNLLEQANEWDINAEVDEQKKPEGRADAFSASADITKEKQPDTPSHEISQKFEDDKTLSQETLQPSTVDNN